MEKEKGSLVPNQPSEILISSLLEEKKKRIKWKRRSSKGFSAPCAANRLPRKKKGNKNQEKKEPSEKKEEQAKKSRKEKTFTGYEQTHLQKLKGLHTAGSPSSL